MISLKNVSKWYGHFQVLTDCTTEVKKAKWSSSAVLQVPASPPLIKTVNGLEPIQQGDILVNGTPVNDKKTNLAQLRAKVGMVFQHFELFPHLSIIDNLTLAQVKVLKRDKTASREKGLEAAGARRPLRPCQQVPRSAVRRPAAARRHRPRAVHGSYRHAVR